MPSKKRRIGSIAKVSHESSPYNGLVGTIVSINAIGTACQLSFEKPTGRWFTWETLIDASEEETKLLVTSEASKALSVEATISQNLVDYAADEAANMREPVASPKRLLKMVDGKGLGRKE